MAFILPAPFWVGLWLWYVVTGRSSHIANLIGSWSILAGFGLLALLYGLQSFSSETDRKILDFILTRPISSYIIVFVKYLLSVFVLLFWIISFSYLVVIDLTHLPMPTGMGLEWILLFLLMIHAMSFLAGVLARGLERLFVIIVLTGMISWISYSFWSISFQLIKDNFFWPDVPQRLINFQWTFFPILLALMSLAIPIITTVWYVKSGSKWWEFKPFLWMAGSWIALWIMLLSAEFLFAPVLRPVEGVIDANWHSASGFILTRKTAFPNRYQLLHCLPGGHPKLIYTGIKLTKPSFSPDGRQVIFTENGTIMVYSFQTRKAEPLTRGALAAWSRGRMILVARETGPSKMSKLYYFDLDQKSEKTAFPTEIEVSHLAWDSANQQAYILTKKTGLYRVDLRSNRITELHFPNESEPYYFSVINTTLVLSAAKNRLFIGQVFDRTIKAYLVDLKRDTVQLSEEKTDFRILTGPPLIVGPELTSLLWPRIDGAFVHQTTQFHMNELHNQFHREHDQDEEPDRHSEPK
jgi:hypothetical protein